MQSQELGPWVLPYPALPGPLVGLMGLMGVGTLQWCVIERAQWCVTVWVGYQALVLPKGL